MKRTLIAAWLAAGSLLGPTVLVAGPTPERPVHHRRHRRHSRRKTVERTGIGAAGGAAVGALVGGGKGAAIGAAVGGGSGFAYDRYKKHEENKQP